MKEAISYTLKTYNSIGNSRSNEIVAHASTRSNGIDVNRTSFRSNELSATPRAFVCSNGRSIEPEIYTLTKNNPNAQTAQTKTQLLLVPGLKTKTQKQK